MSARGKNEIANRVRALRNYADLSQDDFAERLEISRATVARWENPKSDYSPSDAMQAAIEVVCEWPNAFGRGAAVEPLPAEETAKALAAIEQKLALLNSAVENLVLAGVARRQAQDPAKGRGLG